MMASVLISGTIMTVLVITTVQAFSTQDVICDEFLSIYNRFRRCLETNNTSGLPTLLRRLLENDQIITRDELLTELDTMCSTVDIKQPYLNCAETINNACPATDIQTYVATNVEERVAVFCENNTAASWLREVLPNDFMFKQSCIGRYGNVIYSIIESCYENIEDFYGKKFMDLLDQSYNEVLPLFYQIHGNVFTCIVDGAEKMLDRRIRIYCMIRWQDMLLYHWLERMSTTPFGPVIGIDERRRLQEMMSNRDLKL